MFTDPETTAPADPPRPSRVDLKTEGYWAQVHIVVQMHLDIAWRLRREGSVLHGFQELVRASHAVSMNPRLAAALGAFALEAGTAAIALDLMAERLSETEAQGGFQVLRLMARLARRSGNFDAAHTWLSRILERKPHDRRAHAVRNALWLRQQRWAELDASLDEETAHAANLGQYRRASRSALRRARLCTEVLGDARRAVHASLHAAQYAEQVQDRDSAQALRALWLKNLHRSGARGRALEDAAALVLQGSEAPRPSVQSLIDGLGAHLMAVAERAETAGRTPEAAALWAVAALEDSDLNAAQTLEAHLVKRGAWRELTLFYQDELRRAATVETKAHWAEKLAEVLESELKDIAGAAQAWGDVVNATGQPHALAEQVRLLGQLKDRGGVRQALDGGVTQAQNPAQLAKALVLRAEEALSRHELSAAQDDFAAALEAQPMHPGAAAGLAELAALQKGDVGGSLRFLRDALARLPQHAVGRGDFYRRLARLADTSRDGVLSRASWAEVLAEFPLDEEANARLRALTRAAGDDVTLERLLNEALVRQPRGPRARLLRMELVALFERAGRHGAALEGLKQAVKSEPGHREAWLAYAERLISLGQRDAEAVWALEHAATATDDARVRMELWRRLGRFVREQLGDVTRGENYERRAEKLQRELLAAPSRIQPDVLGQPAELPKVRPHPFAMVAEKMGARIEAKQKTRAHVRIAPRVARQWAETDAHVETTPTQGAGTQHPEQVLFQRVDENPLEPEGYRALAEHLAAEDEAARSALMLEIAGALEGVSSTPVPAPRLILSSVDRSALKHSSLLTEGGELLHLVGVALCRINPAHGKSAGTDQPFQMGSGKYGRRVAEALLSAVRILGLRSPGVYLSDEMGPPLSLVFTTEPRILVGKLALTSDITDAELRFFAGRALYSQEPELMVLRTLRREQLFRALSLVTQVTEGRASPPETKLFREVVPHRSWARFKQLGRLGQSFSAQLPGFNFARLAEGARHAANRAGLIVCGAIGPALTSLRAKRALPSEMSELMRFAASEAYLRIRKSSLN